MHEHLACNYITQITSRKWHIFYTTMLTWPCKSLAKVNTIILISRCKRLSTCPKSRVAHNYSCMGQSQQVFCKKCILMFRAMHEHLACNYITQITSRKWHIFYTTMLTWPCKSLAKVNTIILISRCKRLSTCPKSRVAHTHSVSQNLSHTPVTWHPLKQTHMLQFVHPRVHVMLRIYLSRKANPNSSCIHSPPAASSLVTVAR